jgi:hypothetical protein
VALALRPIALELIDKVEEGGGCGIVVGVHDRG